MHKNSNPFGKLDWKLYLSIALVILAGISIYFAATSTHASSKSSEPSYPNGATFLIGTFACNSTGLYVSFIGTGYDVDLINATITNDSGVSNNLNFTNDFSQRIISSNVNATALFPAITKDKPVCGAPNTDYNLSLCVSYTAPTLTGYEVHSPCNLKISGYAT